MSPLKRRLLFGLFGLGLLSVCFWYGYEFLNLARIKQSEKAAKAFCATVRPDMTLEQAISLANGSKNKNRLAISSEELYVQFGQACECRVQIEENKVSGTKAGCSR